MEVAASAPLPAASTPSASLVLDGSGVESGCGADAAGPVGAVLPVGPSTVLLRSRLTSLTVRNLESWSLRWAAMLAASSLKLAKAQLLLEMRNRDSRPSASLHTWCTRPMRSVCGGRFPIQIACPAGRLSASVLPASGAARGCRGEGKGVLTTLSRLPGWSTNNI